MNIAALETIGNLWEKDDMKRLYFNGKALANLIGFEFTTYKTGNIQGASLKGSKLSNSKARKLWTELDTGKCWYDYNDKQFKFKYIGRELAMEIAEALKQA